MDYRKIRHIVFWTVYLAFEIYAEVLWKMGQEPDFQFSDGLKAVTLAECALLFAIKIPIVYLSFFLIAKARKKSSKILILSQIVLVFIGFMMVYR